MVRSDVERDLVTVEGAKRYGVVLSEDGQVDSAATESLRETLRADRGEPEFFDFGGSMEEIISRCKTDTHLDPPVPPTFAGASG